MTAPASARRSWPQRLLITFNLTVIVGALVCAAGLGYLNMKLGKLQRVAVGDVLTDPGGGPSTPQNYLLVGTDSDAGLSSSDPAVQGRGDVTGQRSDTMMLLHIDPKSSQALLLSVPRDLWVKIPGTNGKQKINAAIEIGGPKLLIQTIEQTLNVPINHYVEINFQGFKDLVSAVGGVPIYFNVPVRDAEWCYRGERGCGSDGTIRHSILDVENPGCVTLNPDEALAYARSRYFQYKVNGRWKADENGDLGRISRQQDFVRTALKRALTQAVHDPLKLNSLINSGIKAVTVDDKLTTGDIFALGRKFRTFDANRLRTIELPVVGAGDNSSVLVDATRAPAILAMFQNQSSGSSSGSLAPADVKVQVLNGSGQSGQAGTITRGLSSVGFATGTAGDAAGQGGSVTTIRYGSGGQAAAQLVASYLNGPVQYELSTVVGNNSVVVVTSSTLQGTRTSPGSAPQVPAPTTTTTTTVPGATTSSTPSTIGFVPNQPPPGVTCG
ncbi:MAG TPA: LCP family protein [Acidimicrobiales bacterium]|nr:LCP family protein [Acidimicrobiales bacterium]